jgi:hypothetical protein
MRRLLYVSAPLAVLDWSLLRIEGDLDRALGCGPARSDVVVFRAPGSRMTVSRGG